MERICKTCGQIKTSLIHCIDMTCYIGYNQGDHDGWIPYDENCPAEKIKHFPNEATEEDYKYCPFKELKNDN